MARVLVKPRLGAATWIDAGEAAGRADGLAPPVSGTVYGVILNTHAQIDALGAALEQPPYGKPPKFPVLYIKPPNTWLGHGGEVPVPPGVESLEMGATLAVVIGRTAARVLEVDALDHVLGYTVAIDVCIPHANLHRPAIRQRCRDGFLPIGPWITPREAVPDPDRLTIAVTINGESALQWSTADLVRPVARLIAAVTGSMTLFAGDVLLVGLPPEGPRARVGDRVEAVIEGVGALSCTLVAE